MIDPRQFRTVLSHYPTGVCVVTARAPDGQAVGMTVGSFTSISLDPPLVGFFPDRNSATWPLIERAGRFCVNILAADQEPLCRHFASYRQDRFEGLSRTASPAGQPLLEGVLAWIDCAIYSVIEVGDHYLAVGQVEALASTDGRREGNGPLIFFRGGYARLDEGRG